MVHIKPEMQSSHGAQCAGNCKVDASAVNLLEGHHRSRRKQGWWAGVASYTVFVGVIERVLETDTVSSGKVAFMVCIIFQFILVTNHHA